MIKSVLKEIVIIVLLTAAIVLLLGILFYDYMPTSKVIPSKVQEYAIDKDVEAELEKELNNSNSEEIVKTYLLDATDLAAYEKTKEYNKGKQNPFSKTVSGNSGNGETTGTSTAGSNGNSGTSDNSNTDNNTNTGNSNSNTTTNNTSSGTYLNVVGK